MFDFLITFLAVAIIVLTARLFTVVFHELGHAIPAILLTRKPVSIYIGSYGDPEKSLHFTVGLLDVWFKYNPFSWSLGLCVPSAREISINRQIIYILAGPLASCVIAVIACYISFAFDFKDFKLVALFFLVSSIYDLITNLIPKATPIKLYNGSLTYNDGYQLKQLFNYKRFSGEYQQAAELYHQHKFSEAATSFCELLKSGFNDENIYRAAISSLIKTKNYKRAIELSDEFIMQGNVNSDDFGNEGLSYSRLNEHDKAIALYDKSLELNPNNKYSLNNKGFTLNLQNKFEEAILLFNKAIDIDHAFAHSYNNRGLAKIKLGKSEEGLEDINYSIKLDDNNSYCYRNLGIYHLDRREYSKALDLFRKAKELDSNTHMIDELINQAGNMNDRPFES